MFINVDKKYLLDSDKSTTQSNFDMTFLYCKIMLSITTNKKTRRFSKSIKSFVYVKLVNKTKHVFLRFHYFAIFLFLQLQQ